MKVNLDIVVNEKQYEELMIVASTIQSVLVRLTKHENVRCIVIGTSNEEYKIYVKASTFDQATSLTDDILFNIEQAIKLNNLIRIGTEYELK